MKKQSAPEPSKGNCNVTFEDFTAKALKVIELAKAEAGTMGHNFIGTEQILLGLIGEESGIAAQVLTANGITLGVTRREVQKIIGLGSSSPASEMPITPQTKRMLELSRKQAKSLKHNYIGTEHLLLGLLKEGEGVGARVLENHGIALAKLEKEVLAVMKGDLVLPPVELPGVPPNSDRQDRSRLDREPSTVNTVLFSSAAMESIGLAREESRVFKRDSVGTEQLLVGLLLARGEASVILKEFGVDVETIRSEIEKITKSAARVPIDIPFSIGASQVIVHAWQYSRQLQHRLVHTDHILHALLSEASDDSAIQIMHQANVPLEKLAIRVNETLQHPSDEPAIPAEVEPSTHDSIGSLEDKILYWQAQAKRANQLKEDAQDAEQRCREALAKLERPSDEKPPGHRMFERFTEKAIKTIMLAQEEARRLGHNYVGTEQILLGLLANNRESSARLLNKYGVLLQKTRIDVERLSGRGSGLIAVEMPFTDRAKHALELSWEEAKQLGHNYIGTEHLLFGLTTRDQGVAVTILKDFGVSISSLRSELLELIKEGQANVPPEKNSETDQNQSKMNLELLEPRLSKGAKKVLLLAQEETRRLHHNLAGTEQLLLGLIGEGNGLAAELLKKQGANLKWARIEVEKIIGQGSGYNAIEIPLTPRVERVIEFAWDEATRSGQSHINTEHLLLGLIREQGGVALRVLEYMQIPVSGLEVSIRETLAKPVQE